MSGMTGMELSGKIKLYLPNVKIIFITEGNILRNFISDSFFKNCPAKRCLVYSIGMALPYPKLENRK